MKCRNITVNWDSLVELANDPNAPAKECVTAFVDAFEGLLKVNFSLLEEVLKDNKQQAYLKPFLAALRKSSDNAVKVLREKPPATPLKNVVLALRYSGIPEELVALAAYLDAPIDIVPLEDKQDNLEVVEDSVKELLKKAWNPWWLDPILEAIDEALDLFRGGKGKPKGK